MAELAAQPWWTELYDEAVAELFLVRRDPAELAATLAFLERQLELASGLRVFDQCCGIGSLSLPLAARGLQVVGVDQAAGYIERAQGAAQAASLDCEFHADDACHFVAHPPCQAAFNWWTSFGYFARDAENLRMLSAAHASLAPGGRFALDYPNMAGLLRNFKDTLIQNGPFEGGEAVCTRRSRVDLSTGRLEQTWTWQLPGGRTVSHESAIRLYLPHVLGELLTAAGFCDLRFFGGLEDEPLELDSPRVILVARKGAGC